jgi:cell division protein FtsB
MNGQGRIANWLRQASRALVLVCLGLLAVLIGYKVVFGSNGTMEWRSKRLEYQQLQQKIDEANAQHLELENRVRKLQSDRNTIIKEAREKLGYVMPGEVVLVQPQPKAEIRNSALADAAPSQIPARK